MRKDPKVTRSVVHLLLTLMMVLGLASSRAFAEPPPVESAQSETNEIATSPNPAEGPSPVVTALDSCASRNKSDCNNECAWSAGSGWCSESHQ